MKKFEKFTKENIKEARVIIQEKLDELKSNGLLVKVGGISYDSDSFKGKFDVKLETTDPDHVKEFKARYMNHGFKLEMLNQTFKARDKTYTFLGFIPRKRKYIILVQIYIVKN